MLGGTPANGEGASANILYAGLTPGYVGLYQMNVQVPPATPADPTSLYVFWPGCSPDNGFSNIVTLPVQ